MPPGGMGRRGVPSMKERTCVACGRSAQKSELVRFVRTSEQTVRCDPAGRMSGRGAYLCPDRACFETARKRHALDRALRIKIDDEAYARLEDEFDPLRLGRGAE